jgi:hypothetical protein
VLDVEFVSNLFGGFITIGIGLIGFTGLIGSVFVWVLFYGLVLVYSFA